MFSSARTKAISKSPNKHPLAQVILDHTENVIKDDMHTFQTAILNAYQTILFCQYHKAIFHVDSGADTHATNIIADILIYYPSRTKVDLAVGSIAICESIDVIVVQLSITSAPTFVAPVYYCPQAKLCTLSPLALKTYNNFSCISSNIHGSITIRSDCTPPLINLKLTVHNPLDYLTLPIMYLSHMGTTSLTLASLFTEDTNE